MLRSRHLIHASEHFGLKDGIRQMGPQRSENQGGFALVLWPRDPGTSWRNSTKELRLFVSFAAIRERRNSGLVTGICAGDHPRSEMPYTSPSAVFDLVTRYVIAGFGRAIILQGTLELVGLNAKRNRDAFIDVSADAGGLYHVASSPACDLGSGCYVSTCCGT